MRYLSVSFKLWVGTTIINAIIVACWAFINNGEPASAVGFVVLFGGIFISFPLLAPATWLLKAAQALPYSATAKIVWVACMLLLQNWLFLELLSRGLLGSPIMDGFASAVSLSLVITVRLMRTSLYKLFAVDKNGLYENT